MNRTPQHLINGQHFEVAFVAGQHFYLRRTSDDKLFRSSAVEITSRMYLEAVKPACSHDACVTDGTCPGDECCQCGSAL